MKKFLAILLALTLLLGLCACGGGEKEQTGGVTADGKVKLSIGIPTNAKIMSLEENALTKWLEEQCQIEIEFVEYAGGTDVSTQISTTVAARQELPDILYGIGLNDGAITTYGKDGYFVDLTPYYEDKEGASKNFWSRIEESLTPEQQDTVIRKITDGDTGKIYAVPTIETSTIDKRNYQPWINQTWLDKLGLAMPQNVDDLYKVLVAFNTKDPNGNGDPNDEIPLFGSEKAGGNAQVVNWIMNMFMYYDENHRWQDYNGDGQLEFMYTQEAYREGMKFINKLYKEELLTNMLYTASGAEMKQITTPASNLAMCGIFVGHLTIHCTMGNEVMYEYVPMPLWGNAVESDLSCSKSTFITADCDNPDKAFEVLMTLFSWEGSMRVRYGEYNVNWADADEGAKSDMGLDAVYKLISDPLTQQNTAHWGKIASCFNHYAEGETAQIAENMDEWTQKKSAMHAESRRIFEAAVAANNPENVCPTLVTSIEEQEASEAVRTNINDLTGKKEMAFVTGVGADINNDADWNDFQKQMEELGLAEYQKYVQTAYDRQK
ncbi:MAG: extracellular solute-binding protein [Oscillospiraceae bacterium]|nr:extracellular solute-binding protein [Oscillospiraceae bacterium]